MPSRQQWPPPPDNAKSCSRYKPVLGAQPRLLEPYLDHFKAPWRLDEGLC